MFKLISYYLLFSLIFTTNSFSNIEIKARTAILLDFLSGEILYEKEPDKSIYPASMTKIMTAIIAFDLIKKGDLSLDEKFIVSENASNCSNYNCDFKEIFKMNLNSEVLKSSLNKGLIVRFNSENSFNKVSISAPYLIGYFKIVK